MKRVVCLGLALLLLTIGFVPKARAAVSPPALEDPTDFAVELKSDLRGPYFNLTLTVPESVIQVNENIKGNKYMAFFCQPVEIEIEYKYAGHDWNKGTFMDRNCVSVMLDDYLAEGSIKYLPFTESGWDEEKIKSETYYFRVRFAYSYFGRPIYNSKYSGYSNTFTIKSQGTSRRLYGATRRETAIAVSLEGWPNGAETVILTREDNYPDALTGTPLSKKLDAPILFTNSKKLSQATEEEILRLKPEKVIILGGTAAVSQDIEDHLKKSFKVQRIGGKDRYDTSKRIALELAYTGQVMITTGTDYHDALVGAPMAACNLMPVLLTNPNKIPVYTAEALSVINPNKVIVVGDTTAVSENVYSQLKNPERISGRDYYDTSVKVARYFGADARRIIIVTGKNWPDALSGSGLAAKFKSPTLYVADGLSPEVTEYLTQSISLKPDINILGGDVAVPTDVKQAIDKIFK
jgi:putative cell wall-binding protein